MQNAIKSIEFILGHTLCSLMSSDSLNPYSNSASRGWSYREAVRLSAEAEFSF